MQDGAPARSWWPLEPTPRWPADRCERRGRGASPGLMARVFVAFDSLHRHNKRQQNKMEEWDVARLPRGLGPLVDGLSLAERQRAQKLARKLYEAMMERGMTQSDLARAAWGTHVDARGYTVAKNRDRISMYLAGKALPDPKNMKALADALGMTVEELALPAAASVGDQKGTSLAMQAVAGHPGKAHLRIDMLLPIELAAKIVALISEHERSRTG
jgi:transcriptional regulator with XRE-family HTH domain